MPFAYTNVLKCMHVAVLHAVAHVMHLNTGDAFQFDNHRWVYFDKVGWMVLPTLVKLDVVTVIIDGSLSHLKETCTNTELQCHNDALGCESALEMCHAARTALVLAQ